MALVRQEPAPWGALLGRIPLRAQDWDSPELRDYTPKDLEELISEYYQKWEASGAAFQGLPSPVKAKLRGLSAASDAPSMSCTDAAKRGGMRSGAWPGHCNRDNEVRGLRWALRSCCGAPATPLNPLPPVAPQLLLLLSPSGASSNPAQDPKARSPESGVASDVASDIPAAPVPSSGSSP